MAARKQWSDLSERTRRLLVTAAVAEGILKVAALNAGPDRSSWSDRGPADATPLSHQGDEEPGP
jgi:hypothetical protein